MFDLIFIFLIGCFSYMGYLILKEYADCSFAMGKSIVFCEGDLKDDVKRYAIDYEKKIKDVCVDEFIEQKLLNEVNEIKLIEDAVVVAFRLKYDYLNMKKAIRKIKHEKDFKPRFSKLANIDILNWEDINYENIQNEKMKKFYKEIFEEVLSKNNLREADYYLDKKYFKILKYIFSRVFDTSGFLKSVLKDEIDLLNIIEFKRCSVFTCALEIGIEGGNVPSKKIKEILYDKQVHEKLLILYRGTLIGKALEIHGPIKNVKDLREFEHLAKNMLAEKYQKQWSVKNPKYAYVYSYLKSREYYYENLRSIIKLKFVGKDEKFIREQVF